MATAEQFDWDIFCRVIDNYGDIAVSWRLARVLTEDHRQVVRLWVDDLSALVHLVPEIDATEEQQSHHGITIIHWTDASATPTPARFVRPDGLTPTYLQFLTRKIREKYAFTGVPFLLKPRGKKEE